MSCAMENIQHWQMVIMHGEAFLARLDKVQEELLYYPRRRHWHRFFSSSTLALVISLVTNCVFSYVSLKLHAIKHYICVYELPKLHLHLSTCSLSTDCA